MHPLKEVIKAGLKTFRRGKVLTLRLLLVERIIMEERYILNAIDAALQAGEQILSIYDDPQSDFQIERKADNSPLTIADRKAHETISRFLVDTPFPLLSEEGKHLPYSERQAWETLWIVDPLDGTKEFIKRNGEFTVNIALVHRSVPVMGVIYLPVKRELYFGAEEWGAYKLSDITTRGGMSWDELVSKGSGCRKPRYVTGSSSSLPVRI